MSIFSPRSSRQDPAVDSELAAFDLVAGELLWRRVVPTKGLLNVVSAPHLGEASTYRAMGVDMGAISKSSMRKQLSSEVLKRPAASTVTADTRAARSDLMSNEKVLAATQQLEALGYPNKVVS